LIWLKIADRSAVELSPSIARIGLISRMAPSSTSLLPVGASDLVCGDGHWSWCVPRIPGNSSSMLGLAARRFWRLGNFFSPLGGTCGVREVEDGEWKPPSIGGSTF
jgi:hypothetical protein